MNIHEKIDGFLRLSPRWKVFVIFIVGLTVTIILSAVFLIGVSHGKATERKTQWDLCK